MLQSGADNASQHLPGRLHTDLDGEGWRDVSVPIRTGMVHYPGDPGVLLEFTKHVQRGDPVTVSQLSLGVHTGHISMRPYTS